MNIKKSVFVRMALMLCIVLAAAAAKAQDASKEITDAMTVAAVLKVRLLIIENQL